MRIFILEDDSQRNRLFREALFYTDATFTTSYGEARNAFVPPYDILFLDHDLGGEQMVGSDIENTGATFARWMPAWSGEGFPPTVIVHSYNPSGAQTMHAELVKKGYDVHVIPFGKTVLDIAKGFSDRAYARRQMIRREIDK